MQDALAIQDATANPSPTLQGSDTHQLRSHAKSLNLGSNPEWKRLLYYSENFLKKPRSIIDSPGFFLSPNGKTDPVSELDANIERIFSPVGQGLDPNDHPFCAFPRRRAWLIKNLNIEPNTLPKVTCDRFEEWLGDKSYDGLSVVFSSSYPNNPSSLFGHTFLRLHRAPKEALNHQSTSHLPSHLPSQASSQVPSQPSKQPSKLLDDAINFSAFPDTSNPLTYSLKGVMGFFPGRFSFTPYYLKVQEYSNAESRDLWEYRLNFDREDIANTILALWEMGPHHADYFYFDENCSQIILHFLESIKPSLNLIGWKFWVIPVDTVKEVVNTPEFVTAVEYRPSALKRFLAKYRPLSTKEQDILDDFSKSHDADNLLSRVADFSLPQKAAFLDAVIEYLDFYDRLAGSNIGKNFSKLRPELLRLRATLPLVTEKPTEIPVRERPDIGHDSARIGYEAGLMGRSEFMHQFHWRPALHDKMSLDRGYAAGLGIDFFDFYLRHIPSQRRVDVKEFYPIRIVSLPSLESIVRKPAWNLSLGTDLDYSCAFEGIRRVSSLTGCRSYFLKGGIGLSSPKNAIGIGLSIMSSLRLGHLDRFNDQQKAGAFAEGILESGIMWFASDSLNIDLGLQNRAFKGREKAFIVRHELWARAMWEMSLNHELRVSGNLHHNGYREIFASYYWYF
jgi:hypothetical protein